MPRARRRAQKVGLKRVDAAIDALRPLGFSADLVRKTVKALLKVYEGDAGWVFIEEASYKLLIETILEEQEKCLVKKDNSPEDGGRTFDIAETSGARNSNDDVTGVSLPSTNPETMELIMETDEGGPPCSEDMSSWDLNSGDKEKDVLLKNCEHDYSHSSLGITREIKTEKELGNSEQIGPICSPLPRRRKPCYGWISSDEEIDIVILRTDDTLRSSLRTGRKRKIRWDVRPEDL